MRVTSGEKGSSTMAGDTEARVSERDDQARSCRRVLIAVIAVIVGVSQRHRVSITERVYSITVCFSQSMRRSIVNCVLRTEGVCRRVCHSAGRVRYTDTRWL